MDKNFSFGETVLFGSDKEQGGNDKKFNWPKLEETLVFMGGNCLGEAKDFDSLPQEMSSEAKNLFLEKKPIKIFSFPQEVKIYVGCLGENEKTISVAIFKGQKYVGYDHDYDINKFLQDILLLTGELKLKIKKSKDENVIIN